MRKRQKPSPRRDRQIQKSGSRIHPVNKRVITNVQKRGGVRM